MSSLLTFLMQNKENKGVLAALRCGIVENKEIRAWPYLANFGGIGKEQRAEAIRTVAGLFAYHPEIEKQGNMGTVCLKLCSKDEHPWNADEKIGPMAKKLMYLLSSEQNEICQRVSRIVLYAKAKGHPINYAQLERDLSEWPRAKDAWAKTFWAPKMNKDEVASEDK